MGFFDKLKNMMGVPDEGDYEDDPQDYQENNGEYDAQDDYDYDYEPEPEPDAASRPRKLMNMPTPPPQVVLMKPEQFSEVTNIADHINSKRTVVLNLEATSRELTRRIIDFVGGAAYANNGTIRCIATNTYIIAPQNVDVTSEMLNGIEDGGDVLF